MIASWVTSIETINQDKIFWLVDFIEKLNWIDFFPNLNDKIENSLEKNSNYKTWSLI